MDRATFEAWAAKRWGREAFRHISATSGEWDAWQAATMTERGRIAALIAAHTGLTLETLEYLETMRQGPTPAEWEQLDRERNGC